MQDLKISCAEVFHSQKIVAMINDNQCLPSDKGSKNGFISLYELMPPVKGLLLLEAGCCRLVFHLFCASGWVCSEGAQLSS